MADLTPSAAIRASLSRPASIAPSMRSQGDRLRVTTARFGYGSSPETEHAAAELAADQIDRGDLAATRFDKILKRLLG